MSETAGAISCRLVPRFANVTPRAPDFASPWIARALLWMTRFRPSATPVSPLFRIGRTTRAVDLMSALRPLKRCCWMTSCSALNCGRRFRISTATDLAAGVSDDFPLAYFYAWARVLRIVDGPDAVHRRSVARQEIKRVSPLEAPAKSRLAAPIDETPGNA